MKFKKILALLALATFCGRVGADPLTDRLASLSTNLVTQFSLPLEQWRFLQPDVTNGERPDFDDSTWQNVSSGFSWHGENTKVWFRAKITIPATIAGQSVDGLPVRLDLGMDDDGELYVDGQLKEAFHWDEGRYTLMVHARAGQTFDLAVRGINGPGDGQFHFARLYLDVLPEFNRYLDEANFVALLADRVPADQKAVLKQALVASENNIHFDTVTAGNLASVRDQLGKALADLAPLDYLTRKYDVFYVGHAHIDMNWLWPWTETIDVCHRTWNSAMNLMDEFPEFHYVQSQPGAYVPIEAGYPQEFARMQAMVSRGQWDPVGGLWNESDTDIPSGEGLAQSFMLGQNFFKSKFGKYAVTGWLPDSFGHSWQLPQIMQLVGIRNFYHTRCGNGLEFTWWESPDGSRVLKANTASYDDNVQLDQLAVPAENDRLFGLPQSLVVFGVGDHGGGPTREQILRIKSLQQDPILPQVHFVSADEFFDQLAQQPAAANLPVVDTDLQYTFEGCYTTHADLKKALRSSENNLYTAEVLSSLSSMMGEPYPLKAFDDAWKPTTFAQFHDIACGSAIHSTYDWMHQQLAPAFQFEKHQTERALGFLTASIDTRGPGAQAIVAWNTLASVRDDVVQAPIDDAAQYHSVVDDQGHYFAAQALDWGTLVFVARGVPAFGNKVFFPETNECAPDGVVLTDTASAYSVDTPGFTLQIDKTTGAIAKFYSKAAQWDVFAKASDGNALQLLEDTGSAWDINYTGKSKILTTEGAGVSVVNQGPVFVRLSVVHSLEHSHYNQDLIIYGALPRVDIPTTVNWNENQELLKIRLPVNLSHPVAEAQIPFGSITRPVTGQECPGQKWMDVSQTVPASLPDATPLDLASLFNVRCTDNFDGAGKSYPADLLPAAGVRKLGANQVPFILPGNQPDRLDNVQAAGQKLKLPDHADGTTLYLLAAGVNGSHLAQIGFQLTDDKTEFRVFGLNDWVVNGYPDNDLGLNFPYRQGSDGHDSSPANMWIVQVPIPKGATWLVLPHDDRFHLFAATIGAKSTAPALFGLSVLNDCKYGFDISSNVFRLTALRSSGNPDPHPDVGIQTFTYSLYPHAGGWRDAHTDEQALGLNIPLQVKVTAPHPASGRVPTLSLENTGGQGNFIVSALKHSADGRGFILRFYEADGVDTSARIDFDQAMQVEETDILERPLSKHPLTIEGNSVTLPVGHNQIVTLHFTYNSGGNISGNP